MPCCVYTSGAPETAVVAKTIEAGKHIGKAAGKVGKKIDEAVEDIKKEFKKK